MIQNGAVYVLYKHILIDSKANSNKVKLFDTIVLAVSLQRHTHYECLSFNKEWSSEALLICLFMSI